MADDLKSDDGAGDPGASSTQVDGGAYEIIRARLEQQARTLGEKAATLNEQRVAAFGGADIEVLANERVRTENNCVPVDIVNVEGKLLFGYTVFLGLQRETRVEDVFSVHTFVRARDTYAFEPLPLADVPWLADARFQKDFADLYQYYKDARLTQLTRTDNGRLLAVFRVGDSLRDVKVLRWGIDPDGSCRYIDNRGEEDYRFPPTHDFAWQPTGRENFTRGPHPHVNILDTVFIETVGGDLTVKIEDNTETGEGVYAEPVDDPNQSLDDAQVFYAKLGTLILLKVLPYREEVWRYLVFNTRTHEVVRIDRIGQSCVQLPEDHGIIFPGGYYLQDGDHKSFDGDIHGMAFLRAVRAPNGEDVLYVFYKRDDGTAALLPYNLIKKEVQSPIRCHGWCAFDDGHLVAFRAEEEPTRVHHMRVWRTPFMSEVKAAELQGASAHAKGLLGRVGNAELVRGISDLGSLRRQILHQQPTRKVYEDLIASCTRVVDSYPWLGAEEAGQLLATVAEVKQTAELVVDEFEKVLAVRRSSASALAEAEEEQERLFTDIRPETWRTVDHFVDAMGRLRRQRGRLITLKDLRYIDVPRVSALEAAVAEKFEELSGAAVEFLVGDDALAPYRVAHERVVAKIDEVRRTPDAVPLREELDRLAGGLDLLTEVLGGLAIEDPNARTAILEDIGEVFGLVNRARASLESRKKELAREEGTAAFGAQFKLFTQSVQGALALCDTPERCDEQLTRLLVQLEELEGRFGELDEFLADLAQKRDEVYEAFHAKKQALLEQRQRRAQNLMAAAERILTGVRRRALTITDLSELNAYLASDAMVMKVRDITDELVALGDSVKADELGSRLKATRDEAARQLRDKRDLLSEGDNVITLGAHRFSVNTQALELSLLPKGEGLALYLSGTDYVEPVSDPRLDALRDYWEQTLPSETAAVYRAEYLAASLLFAADDPTNELTFEQLHEAAREPDGLLTLVRAAITTRYDEGYERGVHDSDAALLLEKLLLLYSSAGLLRFSPSARALAQCFWAFAPDDDKKARLARKARSLSRLASSLGRSSAQSAFAAEVGEAVLAFLHASELPFADEDAAVAGAYLLEELAAAVPRFAASAEAERLRQLFRQHLDEAGGRTAFEDDLAALADEPAEAWALCRAWLDAFLARDDEEARALAPSLDETVALLVAPRLDREVSAALSGVVVEGLVGAHPRVEGGKLALRLDEMLARLRHHVTVVMPGFRRFREVRHEVLEEARARLRLDELKPRVLSSFVRNKLISEVYLPFIGENLAKQMGAAGDKRRTDLMGLLLLVSPPGYGKTTLMEYLASRLGLVFMKVNGPSIGHEVTSLDPAEAPNATARQEVEKINFAFEMGNNVMLYLDDIQHTNPELLQKFISLCDGSRRIEGVWKGRTRTYDLRGKKLVVVMAGNPYTETGEKFRVPDMLANRADTYNLGEILGGRQDAFALSYLENALTSNPTLQPLATREQEDVYRLLRMAVGEEVNATELSHNYSSVELEEITGVFRRLFVCRDVLLQVNAEYIRSASMDDRYRTEPPFKLQGSYRNMSKLAAKVSSVMNDDELARLIDDHYQAEAQTLTTGAEQNLLKLAELRGRMSGEQRARWDEIKRTFQRNQLAGGREDDPVARVTSTLSSLGEHLEGIGDRLSSLSEARVDVQVSAPPLRGVSESLALQQKLIEGTLVPVLEALRALAARPVPEAPVVVPVEATPPPLPTPPVSESPPAGSDEVSAQVSEALALLRELKELAEKGALTSSKSYRPFKREPVGTRVKEE